MDESKTCSACGSRKPLGDYNRNRNERDGRQRYCRDCQRAAGSVWRDANREASRASARMWNTDHPEAVRDAHYRRRYGISSADFDALLQRQSGLCAICGHECRTGKRLSVDHCHDTGRIRGLLCRNCNAGLGNFSDNPDLLLAAIKYLRT